MQITSIVDSYWSQTKTLPASLETLYQASNDGSGFVDPVTGVPYEYSAKGSDSFELCATFDRPSEAEAKLYRPEPSGLPNFYQHAAGRSCFTVVIPTAVKEPIPEALPIK